MEVIEIFKKTKIDPFVISETKKKRSGVEDLNRIIHFSSGAHKEQKNSRRSWNNHKKMEERSRRLGTS